MAAPKSMFSNCKICVVVSSELDVDSASKVSAAIEEHEGQAVLHRTAAPLSVDDFTHVVSSTIEFSGYDALADALVPIVKPVWVQTSISKGRLANPRQYSPDPRLFLNDVVASCADIPDGDKDAIVGAVLALGGLYSGKFTSSTTHLVALTMESDWCKAVVGRKMNVKIVLPHWFDDCLRLRQRIDERPYMLPDPEILRMPHGPLGHKDNADIIGASTPTPKVVPQALAERRPVAAFEGHKIVLSANLGITDHIYKSIHELITTGGGEVVSSIEDADTLVCRFREGDEYKEASRAGKVVGNLSWLFHIITHDKWTSPLRRLLHYPVTRDGIPGFRNLRISLSNYAGNARTYLENLIRVSGAESTKNLTQENTHLITAHRNSEKCSAAYEWGLHVVNHLWLEESYAQWKRQPESRPKYTHFPLRTNLTELVGRVMIDRAAIEAQFFPPEQTKNATNEKQDQQSAPETSHKPAAMQDKDVNIQPDRDISERQEQEETAPASEKPEKPEKPNGKPSKPTDHVSEKSPAKPTPSKPSTKSDAPASTDTPTPTATKKTQNNSRRSPNAATPATPYHPPVSDADAGPESSNVTPGSTGSRQSKNKAATRLHDLSSDIALYERESKRVGGVIYGKEKGEQRRKGHKEEKEKGEKGDQKEQETETEKAEVGKTEPKRRGRKRASTEASTETPADDAAAESKDADKTKKARTGRKSLPAVRMHLLVTGYEPWVADSKTEASDKRALRDLGIQLVQDARRCTHLAARAVLRTPKFLTAIAYAPVLLDTRFLSACLEKGEMLDPEDFPLIDDGAVKRHGLPPSLSQLRERAQGNGHRLLAPCNVIFVAEQIPGGWETYRTIIEANGGRCMLFRGRETTLPVEGSAAGEESEVYLLSVAEQNQQPLWNKFRGMVQRADRVPRIVRTDWLTETVLSQERRWKPTWEIKVGGEANSEDVKMTDS